LLISRFEICLGFRITDFEFDRRDWRQIKKTPETPETIRAVFSSFLAGTVFVKKGSQRSFMGVAVLRIN
jgi:hypothetical protein